MVPRIYVYIIRCLLCLVCLGVPPVALSQSTTKSSTRKDTKAKDDYPKYPLLNGLDVSIDLWGPGAKLLGHDNMTFEAAVDLNLHNRFFPVIELGYSKPDMWNDDGIHYKTSAPYFRIGLDYNAFYKKAHGHMLMVGLRYGFTSFKYDITDADLSDDIYGGTTGSANLEDDYWGESLSYSHKGMKGSMRWIEICVGLRARFAKNFYMGWSVRMKYKQAISTGTYGDPQHVPGYGSYGSNAMGVTYNLVYKFKL